MRHTTMLLVSLLTLTLAGCASTAKNDGQVSIATAENGQLFDGADCTVQTDKQSWEIVTPVTLEVGEAAGELRIACRKAGYGLSELRLLPGQTTTGSSGPGVSLGLGGASGGIGSAIGAGLGLSLPFGSTKSSGGYYPSLITVNMTRQANAPAQ